MFSPDPSCITRVELVVQISLFCCSIGLIFRTSPTDLWNTVCQYSADTQEPYRTAEIAFFTSIFSDVYSKLFNSGRQTLVLFRYEITRIFEQLHSDHWTQHSGIGHFFLFSFFFMEVAQSFLSILDCDNLSTSCQPENPASVSSFPDPTQFVST